MYCSKCGKELPEGSRFCPNCGNSVDSSTPLLAQTSSGQEQNAPSTEQQNIPSAPQQNIPPVSEQDTPPVPNEEIKCPKCGATGCTPQYKQNVSGGGYGCCSGGLGALVLGPLGLLCGACGRSVKSTNTLVWICPKCGHEFQTSSKKAIKATYVTCCCLISLVLFLFGVLVLSSSDREPERTTCGVMMLIGAGFYYPMLWYGGIHKARVAYTDEEKQQLKMVTVITGAISLIGALLPIIF